jgi:hypothetical protein
MVDCLGSEAISMLGLAARFVVTVVIVLIVHGIVRLAAPDYLKRHRRWVGAVAFALGYGLASVAVDPLIERWTWSDVDSDRLLAGYEGEAITAMKASLPDDYHLLLQGVTAIKHSGGGADDVRQLLNREFRHSSGLKVRHRADLAKITSADTWRLLADFVSFYRDLHAKFGSECWRIQGDVDFIRRNNASLLPLLDRHLVVYIHAIAAAASNTSPTRGPTSADLEAFGKAMMESFSPAELKAMDASQKSPDFCELRARKIEVIQNLDAPSGSRVRLFMLPPLVHNEPIEDPRTPLQEPAAG